jgi:hypothetical protein
MSFRLFLSEFFLKSSTFWTTGFFLLLELEVFHSPKRDRESHNTLVLVAEEPDNAVVVICAHVWNEFISHGRIQTLPATAADAQP